MLFLIYHKTPDRLLCICIRHISAGAHLQIFFLNKKTKNFILSHLPRNINNVLTCSAPRAFKTRWKCSKGARGEPLLPCRVASAHQLVVGRSLPRAGCTRIVLPTVTAELSARELHLLSRARTRTSTLLHSFGGVSCWWLTVSCYQRSDETLTESVAFSDWQWCAGVK